MEIPNRKAVVCGRIGSHVTTEVRPGTSHYLGFVSEIEPEFKEIVIKEILLIAAHSRLL